MLNVLLVAQVIIVVCMIGVILVQRSNSDGLVMGGGGSNSFLSGRGKANILTRVTSILATLFIINSLALAWLATNQGRERSLIEAVEQAPAELKVPLAEENGGQAPTLKDSEPDAEVQPGEIIVPEETQGEKGKQPEEVLPEAGAATEGETQRPSVPISE